MSSQPNARQREPSSLIEYRGRKPGKLAGTEVTDLAELKKSIVLCASTCSRQFDHRRYGYMKTSRWGFVGGKCDGCGQMNMQNRFYVHETLENEVYTR